jgi:hypothetical protein
MRNIMQKLTYDRTLYRTNQETLSPWVCGGYVKSLLVLLLAATVMLSGCGGSSSGKPSALSVSGNWQFTVANPADQSFLGGLQGGFLLQKGGSVTGGAVYSVSLPSQSGGNPTICNSGSAPITGTIDGQNVTLTAVAGTQTFTFTGALSVDGATMTGTYTSTDGGGCGTAQSGLQWSAASVPPLTGVILGNFHSTGGAASLNNQDFPVTGSLMQGENVGASNATVTGTLSFIDPVSLQSTYPCFDTASVNGQVSGNTVILQIIGNDGSILGQIGGSPGSGVSTVTIDSTSSGNVVHAIGSPAYAVNSKACAGVGLSNAGDAGNICLALRGTTACQQPITLTPAFLTFPTQLLGTTTTQTIALKNNDPTGSTLTGLQLQLSATNGSFNGPSDFDAFPNFTEADTCASSAGTSFSLASGQSCSIKVSYTPQQGCPWIPFGNPPSLVGASPARCPFLLSATLAVNSPVSVDSDTTFSVPLTGIGASAITPSTPELDFGAEAVSQASLPQLLTFTNRGANPVLILGNNMPCVNSPSLSTALPRPLVENSPVTGLQVVANGPSSAGGNIFANPPTINYSCDSDPNTLLPNFQITSDTCTGNTIASQASCSLEIAYVPQPTTNLNSGLDYFLELNTLQCNVVDGIVNPPQSSSNPCEIDSGRFPVELTANAPSPLRMSPGAGLDFGDQAIGKTSTQQTITLFNDPADPNSATVNFVGKVVVKGDYSETDDCPFDLAPGSTCTLTVTFKPKVSGFDPGLLTINVTPEPTGAPQIVQLRGTGH